ncbi:hypothetical protein [Alkalicoccobacillus plakortidis]|uniref:Uncharacterized protein n=1 Tax=Alkalicoccobacillus plakortidis TaxID=444060 RepID=A0ABT0XGK7_9BACI|nr:hypothetical protein [Alkalicoccobacillus plakortidis]MCM2675026.1 hypothetical protein [Alkalicoccobacillus plakortidis]
MDKKPTTFRTKLTPVQLQQRLIYTQSELNKYKAQVERYQNDYYYNMIDELKEKEEQWIREKNQMEEILETTNQTLKNLKVEVNKLRQQEKADQSSATKIEHEPNQGLNHNSESSTSKEITINKDHTSETQTKNQDWFLRSVKNKKED